MHRVIALLIPLLFLLGALFLGWRYISTGTVLGDRQTVDAVDAVSP